MKPVQGCSCWSCSSLREEKRYFLLLGPGAHGAHSRADAAARSASARRDAATGISAILCLPDRCPGPKVESEEHV
ncbi:Hypothetical protein SMAX5B_014416 [Scophthalmus maximus]|uniref:Uncharacterized protein n=1 Tax=Scophthalmus maximus TaxID=52904 RepID=A0A2U9CB76_SCOMX|nr:Hypothetical protein SMAX5B_014416 [Scophthalmus maximus]